MGDIPAAIDRARKAYFASPAGAAFLKLLENPPMPREGDKKVERIDASGVIKDMTVDEAVKDIRVHRPGWPEDGARMLLGEGPVKLDGIKWTVLTLAWVP